MSHSSILTKSPPKPFYHIALLVFVVVNLLLPKITVRICTVSETTTFSEVELQKHQDRGAG